MNTHSFKDFLSEEYGIGSEKGGVPRKMKRRGATTRGRQGMLEERRISINNDPQLISALGDLEVNIKGGRAKDVLSDAIDYVEDNGLDMKAASKIEDAIAELPNNFAQNALVDAIIDYVEKEV